MTSVNVEVGSRLLELDPSVHADQTELRTMFNRVRYRTSPRQVSHAATLALELAQHPTVSRRSRRIYAGEAEWRYEARQPDGSHTVRGFHAEMTRAHLPFLSPNPDADRRGSVIGRSKDLMTTWRKRYWSGEGAASHRHVGRAYELGTCLLTNALHSSLLAFPALRRQDINRHPVDGKPYSWDVSVESDGTVIKEGQYRVQVKSSGNPTQYHPDIHILNIKGLLPQIQDVYILPELLDDRTGQFDGILAKAGAFILDRLSLKDPATTQMAYI